MSVKVVAGVRLTSETECGEVVAWVTPDKRRIVKTPRGWVLAGAGDFEGAHRDLSGAVMRLKEIQASDKWFEEQRKAKEGKAA